MDRSITLLAKIGLCLVQIQRVERTVQACCAAMSAIPGISLSAQDFLSPSHAKRKHTLGQLLKPIQSAIPLGQLDARLTAFTANRNNFTHSYWSTEAANWPLEDVPYGEATTFVDELLSEAIELEQVFRGFFGAIAELTANKIGADVKTTHPALLPFIEKQSEFYKAIVP